MIDLLGNIEGLEFSLQTDSAYVFKYPKISSLYGKYDYISIPKNIDEDTPVYLILDPGNFDNSELNTGYQNTDAIVINPGGYELNTGSNDAINIDAVKELISQINEKLGTNLQINRELGFSRATECAVQLALENIKDPDGVKTSQLLILADPSNDSNKESFSNIEAFLKKYGDKTPEENYEENCKLLAENGNMLVAFEKYIDLNDDNLQERYARFAKYGIPTILIHPEISKSDIDSGISHTRTYIEPITDGILDVLNGDRQAIEKFFSIDGELYEKYKNIYIFDETYEENNGFRQMTLEDMIRFSKGQTYFSLMANLNYESTCNFSFIKESVNSVISNIRASSFLNENIYFNIDSTSLIPKKEEIYAKILNSFYEIYNKLISDLKSIDNIGNAYNDLDSFYAKLIEEQTNINISFLNNSNEYFPNYEEVKSDSERRVFQENGKDYKTGIYLDDNGYVTSMEHYYKFENKDVALDNVKSIIDSYYSKEYIENIYIDDSGNVKVVFKPNENFNITLDDYDNLEELI